MNGRLLSAAVAVAILAHGPVRAEPPAADVASVAEKQFVTVELTVVEVDLTKMRAIGFDWLDVSDKDPITKLFSDAKKSHDFLRALERHGLANLLHRPMLMTLSGRPASIAIGEYFRLDVVPIVLGSGRIRVEHRLELAHSERKLKSDSAVEVDPGQAVIAGHVRSEKKDAAGKLHETATLIIVRADTSTKLK